MVFCLKISLIQYEYSIHLVVFEWYIVYFYHFEHILCQASLGFSSLLILYPLSFNHVNYLLIFNIFVKVFGFKYIILLKAICPIGSTLPFLFFLNFFQIKWKFSKISSSPLLLENYTLLNNYFVRYPRVVLCKLKVIRQIQSIIYIFFNLLIFLVLRLDLRTSFLSGRHCDSELYPWPHHLFLYDLKKNVFHNGWNAN